jgi:hypothetical protein
MRGGGTSAQMCGGADGGSGGGSGAAGEERFAGLALKVRTRANRLTLSKIGFCAKSSPCGEGRSGGGGLKASGKEEGGNMGKGLLMCVCVRARVCVCVLRVECACVSERTRLF